MSRFIECHVGLCFSLCIVCHGHVRLLTQNKEKETVHVILLLKCDSTIVCNHVSFNKNNN